MTSRNTLVMPSTTPPEQSARRGPTFIWSLVAVIVVVGVAIVWWPRTEPAGEQPAGQLGVGQELNDGESISAGDYAFGIHDGNLQVTREGSDGVPVECWSGGSGHSIGTVRVTLQGLVMTRGEDRIYGTMAAQSIGASDPNTFALRVDPNDGTVRLGDVVLAECAPA